MDFLETLLFLPHLSAGQIAISVGVAFVLVSMGYAARRWLPVLGGGTAQDGLKAGPSDSQLRLLERLQKLHQRGEGDRFCQTCAWIRQTQGPELLNWMRQRAEAEGRTGLAARLAEI